MESRVGRSGNPRRGSVGLAPATYTGGRSWPPTSFTPVLGTRHKPDAHRRLLHIASAPVGPARGRRACGKSRPGGAPSAASNHASHVSARAYLQQGGRGQRASRALQPGLPKHEAAEAQRAAAARHQPTFRPARIALPPAGPSPPPLRPPCRHRPPHRSRASPWPARRGLPFIGAAANERSPLPLPARPTNRRAPCVIFGRSRLFSLLLAFPGLARSQPETLLFFFFPGSESFRML